MKLCFNDNSVLILPGGLGITGVFMNKFSKSTSIKKI